MNTIDIRRLVMNLVRRLFFVGIIFIVCANTAYSATLELKDQNGNSEIWLDKGTNTFEVYVHLMLEPEEVSLPICLWEFDLFYDPKSLGFDFNSSEINMGEIQDLPSNRIRSVAADLNENWFLENNNIVAILQFESIHPGTFSIDMSQERIAFWVNGHPELFQIQLGSPFIVHGNPTTTTTIVPNYCSIDIKPGSCPNPLNLKSKGVLPVAVLGTKELDVKTIDPDTIGLFREGVAERVHPIRYNYEDVATPFEGELCDCHDLNGDGYIDLTLKFSVPESVEILLLKETNRTTIPLSLKANLIESEGGKLIEGIDCIRVKK